MWLGSLLLVLIIAVCGVNASTEKTSWTGEWDDIAQDPDYLTHHFHHVRELMTQLDAMVTPDGVGAPGSGTRNVTMSYPCLTLYCDALQTALVSYACPMTGNKPLFLFFYFY